MERQNIIKAIEEEIKATPTGEHVLNIIKATLASIPIGASIASLMTDYIPESKTKRIIAFTKQLAEDLKRLQDRIESNFIQTDQFAYLFERCYRGVAQNYQKEKLECFRAILLNSAIKSNAEQDEKEFFFSLIDSLSIIHIKILKFLSEPQGYLKAQDIDQNSIRGGFSDIFRSLMPNLDQSMIISAFGDLFQQGLITTDKTIFHTMTAASGLHLVGDRVSPFGKEFMSFCSIPH